MYFYYSKKKVIKRGDLHKSFICISTHCRNVYTFKFTYAVVLPTGTSESFKHLKNYYYFKGNICFCKQE